MLAIVCPGQGSQTPGMLAPWLELDGVPELLETFSAAAEVDLVAHGTTSDADTIRDTAVAQPLIVATSLLAHRAIAVRPDVTAGHSVGEVTAAAIAGALDDASAVGLVAHRARAMARAAAVEPTGMSAVVGGDPDEVLAAVAAAGLHPANVNGGGQVVAAGALTGLERLAAEPPARARVIPLQVAGAFHTPFMEPARAAFADVAASWPATDPVLPLLADADGAPHDGGAHGHGTGRGVLESLVAQVVAPVRWDLCQEQLAAMGVTALVELAPGGVLTGLARRTLRGVETVAVRTPEDLSAARELAAAHTSVEEAQA